MVFFYILFSQNEFQWEYLFKQAFRTKNNTNTLFYAIVHYVGVTTNPKYILINVTLGLDNESNFFCLTRKR